MGKRRFSTEAQKRHEAARDLLKVLSNGVKHLVTMGEYPTVNSALVDMCYRRDEHQTFNTFWQWKEQGRSVKKGARGFAVWGAPLQRPQDDPSAKVDEYTYWPLCWLFSNAQVEVTP